MRIIETSYGNEIIIPERSWNSEFTYKVRRVKVLNKDLEQHSDIEILAKLEEKYFRKLAILAFSMDNFFKKLEQTFKEKGQEEASKLFDIWEEHNKMNWNEYFHDGIRFLEEEVNNISFKYADIASVGGYSYCL